MRVASQGVTQSLGLKGLRNPTCECHPREKHLPRRKLRTNKASMDLEQVCQYAGGLNGTINFRNEVSTQWEFLNTPAYNSLNQGHSKIRDAGKPNRAGHSRCCSRLAPCMTLGCVLPAAWGAERNKGHRSPGWGRFWLHSTVVTKRAGDHPHPPGQWEGKEGHLPSETTYRGWGWTWIPNPYGTENYPNQCREAYPKWSLRQGTQGKQGMGLWGVREQSFFKWMREG